MKNKIDFLSKIILGNIGIVLITETKSGTSFPSAQFQIDGYTAPYCLYKNSNSGRMLLHIRDDIPSKVLDNTDFGVKLKQCFLKLLQEKSTHIKQI